MNMIYSNPMVEKSLTAEFCSRKLMPCGPIITPEIMSPIIPGILSFLNNMGESNIMKRTSENTNTGF
jgi:hypothetical protein